MHLEQSCEGGKTNEGGLRGVGSEKKRIRLRSKFLSRHSSGFQKSTQNMFDTAITDTTVKYLSVTKHVQ